MKTGENLKSILYGAVCEELSKSDIEFFVQKIGEEEFHTQLKAVMASHDDPSVKDAIVVAAILEDHFFEEDFIALLRHKDPLVQIEAIEGLVDFESRRALPQIMELKDSTDSLVRAYVFDAIAFLGTPDQIPFLHDVLEKENDPWARCATLTSLARLSGDIKYLHQIFSFLNHEDYRVRSFTVNSLQYLVCDEWRDLIIQHIKELEKIEPTRATMSTIKRVLAEI
ncbi:MAG: HEAT repeat domain-containing protein [Sphingomonadales bacterium]|jgi:HEAT repeat protein